MDGWWDEWVIQSFEWSPAQVILYPIWGWGVDAQPTNFGVSPSEKTFF